MTQSDLHQVTSAGLIFAVSARMNVLVDYNKFLLALEN